MNAGKSSKSSNLKSLNHGNVFYFNVCGTGAESGRLFDSPGLHVEVSFGKILNPKLLLMCRSAPCVAATTISVWMYAWITLTCFGQKHLLNAPKCKCKEINQLIIKWIVSLHYLQSSDIINVVKYKVQYFLLMCVHEKKTPK